MRCPHCAAHIEPPYRENVIVSLAQHIWKWYYATCPACRKEIIFIDRGSIVKASQDGPSVWHSMERILAYPLRCSDRLPCPKEVPAEPAKDYAEACAVLPLSPAASAALSRRCLETILRDGLGASGDDLSALIDYAIRGGGLPPYITDDLHALRTIGNFAAHPLKIKHSGTILPVEPHEAEWNLDVLEQLFDFFYVQRSKSVQRKEALNEKLRKAGKKPLQ